MKNVWVSLGLVVLVSLLCQEERLTARPIQINIDRWLELKQVKGSVTYQRSGQSSRKAQVGMKLQAVGDTITTSTKSSAVLSVDTGIGFVLISENSIVKIQALRKVPDGGHITRLQVLEGQARLQVRRFTHPSSQLEVQTPAGISGVRGTQFGVAVKPDGKTGVATSEGSVVTSAQGRSVLLKAGFQNLIVPGEPPSPPVPLQEDTGLNIEVLAPLENQKVRVVGQSDPVNLVTLTGEQPVPADRSGRFDLNVPLPANRQLEVVVITPLGKKQVYRLVVP